MSTQPYWTVLVDEHHCLGRFTKHADAKHAAIQLSNRLSSCRPRPVRLHHDLNSLQQARSTR